MIMYEADRRSGRIERITVVKETQSFVTVEHQNHFGDIFTQRQAKESDYTCIFSTFAEAKAFVVLQCERRCENLKMNLQKERSLLSQLKKLEDV